MVPLWYCVGKSSQKVLNYTPDNVIEQTDGNGFLEVVVINIVLNVRLIELFVKRAAWLEMPAMN